ncbi:MAG TPA: DUF6072 family protein [Stellaceae bacterium]|nr:DUF6072 family protein [Stellaceae bacterium]
MLGQQENVLGNSIKLLGEVFVPGASELLEGKLGSGAAHFLIASAAALALGGAVPVLAGMTVLAVKADSFSRSVNGRSLFSALNSAVANSGGTSPAGGGDAPAASRTSRSGSA